MTMCLDMERNYDVHKRWIEKYKYQLEILKKDHELIVDKEFDIFFAVDFYDIYEYCFPYDNILGRISDYKDENKRRKLMELQFARSFLFYGTDRKSSVLLPPYASEVTDFFKSQYATLQKYKSNDLKRNILKILFQDKKVQDILKELEKKDGSPERRTELLTMITKSSSDVFFLLSSGFLEGMKVLGDLFKKRTDSDDGEPYRIIDPEPRGITCYNDDVREEIGNMKNRNIESMFFRPGKYIQNRRDAKALQYIVELNKRMTENSQAIFLASNADYMRKRLKGAIMVDIEGEKYDSIRDFETFYVYLIEIKDIGYPKKRSDQRKILEKIKKSLEEFEGFSRFSQEIPQLNDKCEYWREENKSCEYSKSGSHDTCQYSQEFDEINDGLARIEELRSEIENINLMKQIDVVLSPLFSENRKDFLKLETVDFERKLMAIFSKIGELAEDRDKFVKALEKRENQLEDQTLQELFNVSFDSLSVQEPFMKVDDILFLIRLPFRLRIPEGELKDMLREIKCKAAACKNEYTETGKISEEGKKELNESLRKLAKFSREIEDDNKYLIWQVVFLCNKRFDLIRIWSDHYRSQIENEEMKRESDYLFCLACYFDMPDNRELFLHIQNVSRVYSKQKHSDSRFYHILSLALLRLFESSSERMIFGNTREDLIDIFDTKLMAEIDLVDEEFQTAIKNNYCYAMSLLVGYQEDRTKYKHKINEIKEIMETMREDISKDEWLYNHEDTLGYIYFLIAKYFEEEKRAEYAEKAKACFKNAEKDYQPHERRIRISNIKECDNMLSKT